MSIKTRLTKLEQAAAKRSPQELTVEIDSAFFGNAGRPPVKVPAHQCPNWYDGGDCQVCAEAERMAEVQRIRLALLQDGDALEDCRAASMGDEEAKQRADKRIQELADALG